MLETRTVELHFRDGFSGQSVTILVNEVAVAAFAAKTRMQIGLARIETVQAAEGDDVQIEVEGLGRKPVPIVKDFTQYAVDLRDNELTVTPARTKLLYM